jgi:hypothetical protein
MRRPDKALISPLRTTLFSSGTLLFRSGQATGTAGRAIRLPAVTHPPAFAEYQRDRPVAARGMLCGSWEPARRNPSAKEVRLVARRADRCSGADSGREKVYVIRVNR